MYIYIYIQILAREIPYVRHERLAGGSAGGRALARARARMGELEGNKMQSTASRRGQDKRFVVCRGAAISHDQCSRQNEWYEWQHVRHLWRAVLYLWQPVRR